MRLPNKSTMPSCPQFPLASRRLPLAFLLAIFWTCGHSPAAAADFQGATHMVAFDEDAIAYSKSEPTGPIARLQKQIDVGRVTLGHDSTYGYLLSLLDALHIATNSQVLVFSKTSFQRERISPKTPRALYFNDDVYVGFIPGSPLMEVSMADPKLGGVFYSLEQKEKPNPRFVRTDQCLECHASSKTLGVPGHLLRSFRTDAEGVVDLTSGISLITDRTPFVDRWGGWYVTGRHGHQLHRGNLVGPEAFERQAREPNYLGNLASLDRFLDVTRYPEPGSDIVALMVLQHQVHMHNLLTRLHDEATLALVQYGHVRYLKSVVNAVLRYLLFLDAAPLESPVQGTSQFETWFCQQGPRDRRGRSLREFDLHTRLFKYPCSYLIYSEAFDQLPGAIKEVLYERLWNILQGRDTEPGFKSIPAATRGQILEILRETKHDLPAYWRSDS